MVEKATGEAILALSRQGMPINKIARTTGRSRKLVRGELRGLTGDVFRTHQSSLDAYLPRLDPELAAGCRTEAELWRRLRANGFTGGLMAVGEWATRRRSNDRTPEGAPSKVPSVRILSRLMTTARGSLTEADTVLVATIEAEVLMLYEARALLSRFQAMIRERKRPVLDIWIEAEARSLRSLFARGLLKDKVAVAAALTQPWLKGHTEG